jgi:crotonobetainyl-CoA:carnitine CoA-transferase CaiB-like acyl-CoA transferase
MSRAADESAGALAGVRVIDLSKMWAGPALTELLGNMGAQIIKVEAVQSPDLWRGGGARLVLKRDGSAPTYETSPVFNAVNRNKYGITLDLTQQPGRELLTRLVALADIVVENYPPRVMKKFELDYDSLRRVRPEIIMISLPALGGTGPWKDFIGFAYPTEQFAGYPHLTGYPDSGPMLWGSAGADAFAGLTGAVAVLAALEQRRRTGVGQFIDLSQVETLAAWHGQPMIDYCWNKRLPARTGNRSRSMAPHDCYRCSGPDRWLVIAVEDDEQWQALCRVLDRPDLASRAALATLAGRLASQDEIDAAITAWTCGLDHCEAAQRLQSGGVAAAPVLEGGELLEDPHLQARGFIEWHVREWIGNRAYTGMWAKFSRTPGTIRRPAPLFGEHNEQILRGLLGLSAAQMKELEQAQVIGKVPQG